MGRAHKFCITAVAAALVALGGTAPAFAVGESHPFTGVSFGRSASEAFANPDGIAVDEATGDVYVADIGTDTVYKFDADGTPVDFTEGSGLGTNALAGVPAQSGQPAEAFSFPSLYGSPASVAVDNACVQHTPALSGRACEEFDPSAGDLYVMDAGHGVIDKFSPEGRYLSQLGGFESVLGITESAALGFKFKAQLLGVGVDGSGNVHVDLTTPRKYEILIDEFNDAAVNQPIARQRWEQAYNGNASLGDPLAYGFAVSASGDNYSMYEPSCSCAARWGQHGSPLGRVDSEEAGDVAVAVDPATGHLYADDQSSVSEWDTGAMNSNAGSSKGGAGTLVARFGSSQLSGSSGEGGIAVDGASSEIYVSNAADGKVYAFASDAPSVTVSAASGVSREAASLSGAVDPHGAAVSSCEFEYDVTDESGNGPYIHSVPCEQTPADIGSGSDPVAVTARLEALEPGELYHYRLVAANANGAGEASGLVATQGTGFGIKKFEVSFLNEDGTPDTQAGSHPFMFVDIFELSTHFKRIESNADSSYVRLPNGVLRDLKVDFPPGFVGDPNATPKKCTGAELRPGTSIACPVEARVGQMHLYWSENLPYFNIGLYSQLYNMVPPRGEALQLGTEFYVPDLYIENGLLAGGDYPVQASVTAAPTTAPFFRSKVEVPGIVGRCTLTVFGCTYSKSGGKPFLTLPTGCHGPLRSTMAADSWSEPGHWVQVSSLTRNDGGMPVSLTGCSRLKFPAEISVSPDSSDASTSSGLAVNVHVPQTATFNPEGLAESSLRDTTVTLPQGITINPSGGDGLEACSSDAGALPEDALGSPGDQIGYKGQEELNAEYEPGVKWNTFTPEVPSLLDPGVNFCPNGSKIGTVKIKTPLLEHELEGAVYLAAQDNNPFGSLVAMYLVAEDPYSGSLIKLAGEVRLTESGQVVTTFKNTPDLPFENLELHFFGGERAPLSTPSRCGKYTTTAVFTPWDGNGPVTAESSFEVEHGPHGGPCPGASLPFQPSLTVGTASNQAGGFTPFEMTMSREDGQQNLQAISLKMPPGLSGILTGVELCPEPQADEGTCGPNSLIGETTVSVGVGNDPFSVKGGRVYLTGPYRGAPFGLSIVNPAKAGPFDLESTPAKHPACDCLVVRAKIEVNPFTAALTVTSDNEGEYKIPTMIEGIPLQIQHVNVAITRPGFTFNPTDCDKQQVGGTLESTEGAASAVAVPFQATNCSALGFAPKFAVSTSGKTSRAKGASLTVHLSYPNVGGHSILASGLANIRQVKVELPKALPSRLTTLQKACTQAQFQADPAGCPPASVVGHAKAVTPLLPVPLEGPAYFVSNGGEAFPNLIVVLQGYGVTIDLVGDTFINEKTGITSSTFKTVPDAPVGMFELTLPQGPYSALTANTGLCQRAGKLNMPTEFQAQNGALIKTTTKIAVTGCGKVRKASHHRKRAHRAKRKHRRH